MNRNLASSIFPLNDPSKELPVSKGDSLLSLLQIHNNQKQFRKQDIKFYYCTSFHTPFT